MSEFERKKQASLAALRRTNISERNYLPPTFSLLWRCGVKIPPPHFMHVFPLILVMGLPFGLSAVGFYMMDLDVKPFSFEIVGTLVFAVTAFFGGGICFYYRASARLHGLPKWKYL